MRKLIQWISTLALFLTAHAGNAQIDRITGKNFATRSEVLARHGMVCTSVPAATQVGVDILKRGGSAVDAAIAANATLGLMEPVAKGDIFKNPMLAKTLRLIGKKGRDAFYKSEIADKIDSFMQANGGFLRKADFEKHASTWVDPVSTNYRGYDVFELPPNGQGVATLQILNILEGFDLRAMGRNSPETLHAMIEAKKIASALRAEFYADPAFAKIPLAGLLSKSYATERRKLIDPNRAAKNVAPGTPTLDQW